MSNPSQNKVAPPMLKRLVKGLFNTFGFEVQRYYPQDKPVVVPDIPDREFYRPQFQPWRGYGNFKEYYAVAKPYTLVSAERCYVLYTLARQAMRLGGEFWECGVYKGGTASMLGKILGEAPPAIRPKLRLFDTFEGMPEADASRDIFKKGDLADTGLEEVRRRFAPMKDWVEFHPGFIPDTFANLQQSKIAFAHIDVDIYKSIWDCCEFIYPRIVPGGFIIFDDYGFDNCPGARQAVDAFFADKPEEPLVLRSGQAIVFRSSAKASS